MSVLYVVATPIGNLNDITSRAVEVLKSVAVIAAEDTRHTKKLLRHLGIQAHVVAHHSHNEAASVQGLLDILKRGDSVALVSDAGTPLISDPGGRLVGKLLEEGFQVIPVPGPCSVIAALSVAGFTETQFCFSGFVPAQEKMLDQWMQSLSYAKLTTVCFEAPHRIEKTLMRFAHQLQPTRQIVVAREITKQYETVLRLRISELLDALEQGKIPSKGEFVLLVEGVSEWESRCGEPAQLAEELSREEKEWLLLLSKELPKGKVASLMAKKYKKNKKQYYDALLNASEDE